MNAPCVCVWPVLLIVVQATHRTRFGARQSCHSCVVDRLESMMSFIELVSHRREAELARYQTTDRTPNDKWLLLTPSGFGDERSRSDWRPCLSSFDFTTTNDGRVERLALYCHHCQLRVETAAPENDRNHRFLPRDMLCIRGTSHGPVSVRLLQVGVLSKRLNKSSWVLACEFPSTRPTLC